MKRLLFLLLFAAAPCFLLSGESSLTVTYQPLDGLGAGGIHITQVTCHDWYGHSGMATAINLISAPNVPPTNNPKEATEDLNLASRYGVSLYGSDIGDPDAPLELTLDLTQFKAPEETSYPREVLIRSCLECLRRCLPAKLKKAPLKVVCKEADKKWAAPIVKQFNAHDRGKVFFVPEE